MLWQSSNRAINSERWRTKNGTFTLGFSFFQYSIIYGVTKHPTNTKYVRNRGVSILCWDINPDQSTTIKPPRYRKTNQYINPIAFIIRRIPLLSII